MNKPSLDGFSCSLSRQTSSNKAQASSRVGLYSIEALLLKNCTCTLPGTPKEFVFTDSSHFVPLSAVEYCKGSKISLLSTCLLLLSLSTAFWSLLPPALEPVGCFCEDCRFWQQALYTVQPDKRPSQHLARKGWRCDLTPYCTWETTLEGALGGIPDTEQASQSHDARSQMESKLCFSSCSVYGPICFIPK